MVKAFDAYSTQPELTFTLNEDHESVEGFHCDDKLVFVLHLAPETLRDYNAIELHVRGPKEKPASVVCWDAIGEEYRLLFDWDNGRTLCQIPLRNLHAETAHNSGREIRFAICYLIIE